MLQTEEASQAVIFSWDPVWVASVLFLLTYAVIVTEKINRAIIALLGAGLMILSGVLTQQAAIEGIDFNTLGLLTGMMVIVTITKKSGIFQYIAIWSAKKVNADPWGILVMLSCVTVIFSALLDNVTTVLLIAPVTLLITQELKVSPYPYLFAEIFASNIGGAATLIGDPPNIMIGSAVGLTFNDFLLNIAPIIPVILVVNFIVFYFIWGRHLHASKEAKQGIMLFDEKQAITDILLLKQSLFVMALVITGFLFAHSLHLEPATIAMLGAALLLLLISLGEEGETQSETVQSYFAEVEWVTIFFFVGLFIIVYGVEKAGILATIANKLVLFTEGDKTLTTLVLLWVSAIFSALVDNIPFVATLIPVIESMEATMGGAEALMPLWWALTMGACLGGNGSLIGASANLIIAGYAERAGYPIEFLRFMLVAFPLMLVSIVISHIYIYLRYLL